MMRRMIPKRISPILLIALSLAGCDPGAVVVNGKANGNGNGNCNGKNNCNNNEAESLDSGDSGDSLDSGDSGEDDSSTTGMLDMAGSEDSSDSSDSTDTETSTEDSGESDTDEPEPGLPGCGNGLPFAGDLCYLPTVNYNIGTARSAAIGDMNGDGHLDVVVVTGGLAVYANNGSGALAFSSSVGVPNTPTFLALGDVDGDGDLDVAVNGSSTVVRLHFNNGAGVITPFNEYVTFGNPREVVLADLDEDGDLDLAYAHSTERKIVVRKNNGLGTFGAQAAYDVEAALNPNNLIAADMDGDGALDLVSGTIGAPVIIYNYGNGTFDGINEQILAIPNSLLGIAVDDYDLDGHNDIAAARSSASMFRVAYGMGQKMFDPMILDVPTTLFRPQPLVTADFDVDGIPDLASASDQSPGNIAIHRGDGEGFFHDGVLFSAKTEAAGITAGDLNGDDVPDIVMSSDAGTPGLSVLLSNP